MTNVVPSEEVIIENTAIEIVEKYIYLDHEIRISKGNQITKLLRRKTIGWTALGKLCDIFKAKIPMKLKRKAFNQCVLPILILME